MKTTKKYQIVAAILMAFLFLATCSDPKVQEDSQPADAPGDQHVVAGNGDTSTAARTKRVDPGLECEFGGIQVDTGIDEDGDGFLDDQEVDNTEYVCNGAPGADGAQGLAGLDGQDGTQGDQGPAGLDGADGTNGVDGADGTDGSDGLQALVDLTTEPAGSNCSSGGVRIDTGLDNDQDGLLDADEITETAYVCNGNAAVSIPTDGLVAYYPFNGNANDESGNGNNGTVNGATLTSDRNGNADKAYSFDGTNYISLTNPNTFQFSNNFSITLWFTTLNSNTTQIFSQSMDGNANQFTGYGLQLGSDALYGNYFWKPKNSNTLDSLKDVSSGVSDGNWHMVTVIASSTLGMQMYIDGILVKQDLLATSDIYYDATTPYTYIGGWNNDGIDVPHWQGQIDDIRIYNRALTEAEVTALYNE